MTRGIDFEKVEAAGGPPSLPEAGAVFAALTAYRQALGLAPGEMSEAPQQLEELRRAIEKVQAITITEGGR